MVIKRALVVDDSKAAGLALLKMLEQHRVAVDLAESAEAALAYLRNQRPDVIFMDHIMPGMNGLEAARTITGNPQTATIPIVMYTSTEGPSYPEKAKAHGAVGVLPKPPKPAVLAQFIQQLSAPPEAETPKAPMAAPAVPSAAAAAPTPPSTESLDSIARRVAESVVQNGVQSLVTRLVDDQLTQLRDDMLARCENVAKQAAGQVQHARTAELLNLLRKQIQDQLAVMSARLDEAAPSAPVALEEIKNIARSVANQEAADAATRVAQATALQVGQEVAQSTAGDTARRVTAELAAVYDARTNALAEQLRRHVQNEIAAINARLATTTTTIPPAVVEDLTHMMRTVANREAAAVATQTAQTVTHQAALEAAEQTVATARHAVDELCTTRINALAAQLRKEVAGQFGELTSPQAGQANIPLATLAEIKNVARFVASQKAGELAQRAVHQVARETGLEIGKQATQTAVRQVERALDIAMQSQMRRMYLLAGASAAVGVIAATVVYLLH